MSGFKNFILRGNLVDLAVAVVIGAQFSPSGTGRLPDREPSSTDRCGVPTVRSRIRMRRTGMFGGVGRKDAPSA